MPKLTRLHLTGIGHKDAKFDKLSLRFTNDRGQPAHTLLWLPNGGGKSLLIAFKYAALRPHKNDFLVQKTGRGADLIDFIEPGRMGVVLLEFEDTEMGTGRRVVGYAALRRDRDLERWFFTFRVHPSLAWESLPVRGLGTPAPTLLKLRQHFQAAHAQDRARIEYFETDNQSRWSAYLRDRIGLDPEIFRHHLVMNSDEGGVIKVFAHRDLDAFVRLFLELAIEPESLFKEDAKGRLVDQAREAVADYKRSVLENPRRELTRDLCAELLPVLRNLNANLARRQELVVLAQQAETDLARLKRAVADHLDGLQKQQAELEKQVEEMRARKIALKNEFNKLERWANGYECLRKRLYFQETLEWQTRAGADLTRAEYRLRLLRAARAAAELRAARANLDALNEERAQKLAALQPDLDVIQVLGGQLAFWIEDRATRLEEEQTLLAGREQEAKNAALEAARELNQVQIQLAQHRREYTTNKGNLAELDKARRRLRAESLVEPDESAEQATARWKRIETNVREDHRLAAEQRETFLAAAKEAQIRRETALHELNRVVRAREETERHQARLQRLTTELRNESGFLAAGGTIETSPWNPTLSAALEGKIRAHRERIVDLQIAGADDQRVLDRYQPPDRPLFPPPRETELVLDLLRSQQVRTALPAYAELAAAHPQTSAAENVLRAAPAETSGIIIQDRAEFERAKKTVREAAISRPMVIVLGGNGGVAAPDRSATVHVVLPQDRGLWNAAMAKADLHSVSHRCEERNRQITDAETAARDAERALQRVEQIRTEFTEDQPGNWRESLETLAAEEKATRDRAAAEEAERLRAEESAEEVKRRLPGLLLEADKARANATQLEMHVLQFERHAEEWRSRDAELITRIEEGTRTESAASIQKDQAEASLGSFAALWQDLRERRVALEVDRRRLSPGYVGKPVASEPGVATETLWGKFESQIRLYEGKANDEALKARHAVASAAVTKALSEYNGLVAKDLPAALIESESRAPDHERRFADALGELDRAKKEDGLARNEHARATADCPFELRKHNDRETVDDARPAANRLEAERLRDICRSDMEAKQREREAHDERLHESETAFGAVKAVVPRYEALLDKCEGVPTAELTKHPEFRGEAEADQVLTKRLVQAMQTQRDLLVQADAEAEKIFKNRWTRVIMNDRFMRDDFPLRAKLTVLAQSDLERKIAEHLKTLDDIHAACESELAALAGRRASLVTMLAERAELAARRLKALERVSHLPKELDAWGGQPFLKVDLKLRNDPAERAHHLGELVERWARETQEDALPTGATLAHESLKALLVGGQVSIRVLKPTQRLELFYHDITALAGFSEGQRLTAAILIYCVLVRLRRQNSAQADGLVQDAGYLLLDNPLGKANHTALVDLQLRVARAMGVQLIYASGINDPGALVHFGHIVRLKNTALDPRTGDKLVQVDAKGSNGSTLSATEVGVQPRAVVPPPPPKPAAAGTS